MSGYCNYVNMETPYEPSSAVTWYENENQWVGLLEYISASFMLWSNVFTQKGSKYSFLWIFIDLFRGCFCFVSFLHLFLSLSLLFLNNFSLWSENGHDKKKQQNIDTSSNILDRTTLLVTRDIIEVEVRLKFVLEIAWNYFST